MHPDDVQAMKETLEAAFRDHQPREVEYRGRCKDGRWIWVRARAMGAYEKDGVQYLQGLLSDITERKQAEQALQESQSRLQAIVDSVQTGIVIIDPETHRIVDVNPVALELIGAPRDQVVGAECHKFICPAERGRCPVSDLGQTVDNSERVLLTVSGERRAIIKTVVPVVIGGRQHLLESFIDITERKRAEEELALLKHSIDVHYDGAYWTDADNRLIYVNDAGCKALGYGREELIGKTMDDVIPEGLSRDPEARVGMPSQPGLFLDGTGAPAQGRKRVSRRPCHHLRAIRRQGIRLRLRPRHHRTQTSGADSGTSRGEIPFTGSEHS